jgi:hypothetical protein
MFPNNCRLGTLTPCRGTDFGTAGYFVVQSTPGKEFQDEQTATGQHSRLRRIGDSGFRASAEQFDKFTRRGPAADQHSELQFVVHDDATINIDAIEHDIDPRHTIYRLHCPDSAFELDDQPVCSRAKFDNEPVGPRRIQPLAGAKQYSGGATWRNDARSGADQHPGSREQPGTADPE